MMIQAAESLNRLELVEGPLREAKKEGATVINT